MVPSVQDNPLLPVMMKHAFMSNVLALGALAHRSCYEANKSRTLAVFAASYAAQTAARCALSLGPMAAPWRMVSGTFHLLTYQSMGLMLTNICIRLVMLGERMYSKSFKAARTTTSC